MNKFYLIISFILLFANWSNAQIVKIIPDEAQKRIDVKIDGQLFTSYRYLENIKRPVLLPIMTANGGFKTAPAIIEKEYQKFIK